MAQKSDKETTVVATFDVVGGSTEASSEWAEHGVRTHEKAWVLTLRGPHPASAKFVGWKRKD